MVLLDWMTLGVTEDEEEIVAHETVSLAPGILEEKVQTRRTYFDTENKGYS